jgi:hypothetical protein
MIHFFREMPCPGPIHLDGATLDKAEICIALNGRI